MCRLAKVFAAVVLLVCCQVVSHASVPDPSAKEAAIDLYRNGRVEEAAVALDNLVRESPEDDSLKVWKALAMLEKANRMREEKVPGYKTSVVQAYAILKPLAYRMSQDPDWCYAMAKAYCLNDRPMKAEKALKKALYFRQVFPEAFMLLGDIAYEEGVNAPPPPLSGPPINPREEGASKATVQYDRVLKVQPLRQALAAEASYKQGMVELALRDKKEKAVECWQRAVAAAPQSRYGKMAQERLGRGPGEPRN